MFVKNVQPSFKWIAFVMCAAVMMILFTLGMQRSYIVPNKWLQDYNALPPAMSSHIYTTELVQEPMLNQTDADNLSDAYEIAVSKSQLHWTDEDLNFFLSTAGETVFSQLAVKSEPGVNPNFSSLTAAERLYKALFQYFNRLLALDASTDFANDERYSDSWEFYKRLEDALYPWIYTHWENAFHINNQTHGKGIVMCVGNEQFMFAASTIRAIRDVLHNDLPIEIFYIRDGDLSETKQQYLLNEFSNLTLKKLDGYVDDYYTKFGGYAMKPFAMLASEFEEMIMMDADVFFLQDPSRLFQDDGYLLTGSLFFHDRTLFADRTTTRDWIYSFMPSISTAAKKFRWLNAGSLHEQESGVVVMNKKKALLGLLSTCKLNAAIERDQVVYQKGYGDKETFWVGHEIMQTPYAFLNTLGGVIGDVGYKPELNELPTNICGVQLHFDKKEKPLWFNGGLFRAKRAAEPMYNNFTYYAQGEDWYATNYCLKDTDRIQKLQPTLRRVAMDSIEIDKERAKIQTLIDEGKWKPENKNT